MTGYTKLFNSIVGSTIWREDDKTRLVWITMLAMRDRFHVVEASIPGLADFAKVSLSDCEKALEKLSSPDPYSRTPDFEGRRIKKVEGGWHILNGEKYRQKMSSDERREANRIYQQRHRERKKHVSKQSDISAMSAQAEAEAETKKIKEYRLPPDLFRLEQSWKEWLQYKRERRQPMTKSTFVRQVAKLKRWGIERGQAAIEYSIESGYMGLFEPPQKREYKRTLLPEEARKVSKADEQYERDMAAMQRAKAEGKL